jgi:protein-tyrosine kinase
MNRIEEALRRAQQQPKLPESYAAPQTAALDRFPAAVQGQVATPLASPVLGPEFESATDRFEPEPEIEASQYTDSPDDDGAGAPAISFGAAADDTPMVNLSAFNPDLDGKLIIGREVKPVTVEQYRRLAATLHHAQCDNGTKVVMVASAVAGEGKTVTAVNLALTLSESYARRVLLIDADFRRPTLHKVFQVPNVSGLNDSLKAQSDGKLTIIEISPRLSLLPAGRPDPDPMSGLTSGRMQRIIAEAAEKFDWVVLDTPPIGLITDAHLLAAMVHVAVLVVQAGRTPFALIQQAIERLDRSRVIGVVLNWVEERATLPGGKYGGYYSSYYGGPTNGSADVKSKGISMRP